MGDKTGIEWTDASWNPITGCSKVSPGCAHCYAEGVAARFWPTQYPLVVDHVDPDINAPVWRHRRFTDVMCHEDRLVQPLRWKKPRRVFVNSMADLFHEDVPDAFIDKVFAVMALCPQHIFQVLTKRPERMRAYFGGEWFGVDHLPRFVRLMEPMRQLARTDREWNAVENVTTGWRWPLPKVWLGTSVENQRFADERIPLLLQTPAVCRFVSCEPLLGPIDLTDVQPMRGRRETAGGLKPLIHFPEYNALSGEMVRDRMGFDGPRLDWVIAGGESGPGARPCELSWLRAIVAQCQAAGVACFVKQLGAHAFEGEPENDGCGPQYFTKDRKGGDPSEWPDDLRVREFPA